MKILTISRLCYTVYYIEPQNCRIFAQARFWIFIPLILSKWEVKAIENFKKLFLKELFIIKNPYKILISMKLSKEYNKKVS